MPPSGISLLDLNVWLALAYGRHSHHPAARRWFESLLPGTAAFSRVTQLGLLRLLSTPAVVGADAVSQSDAWRCYDALASDERVIYLDEPDRLETIWRSLTRRQGGPEPKTWTDAYLAAFALAAGVALVSFDGGFQAFRGLNLTLLEV